MYSITRSLSLGVKGRMSYEGKGTLFLRQSWKLDSSCLLSGERVKLFNTAIDISLISEHDYSLLTDQILI